MLVIIGSIPADSYICLACLVRSAVLGWSNRVVALVKSISNCTNPPELVLAIRGPGGKVTQVYFDQSSSSGLSHCNARADTQRTRSIPSDSSHTPRLTCQARVSPPPPPPARRTTWSRRVGRASLGSRRTARSCWLACSRSSSFHRALRFVRQ